MLGLERLPGEGDLFRRTYADVHCSVVYFLLLAPAFSALHALDRVEIYHWGTLAGITMAPAFELSAFRLGAPSCSLAGRMRHPGFVPSPGPDRADHHGRRCVLP